ncbi:hypothetical protein [Saccharothrix australiensis]|uniref:Secreted protein n=1 Tax=Saccharothrix australiensis TaxID=2072 RepID=A0A495W672_9PSEU|nr:hypothetical protein [Saccharothrix australiensis]RKT55298.1 hypothetical protein C8E97_3960 [Saccharothrix australiensis]
MKKVSRALVAVALSGLVLTGTAGTALADPVVVDEPDTGGLENIWTFTPVLGVPLLGLVQSVVKAPNGLIPN